MRTLHLPHRHMLIATSHDLGFVVGAKSDGKYRKVTGILKSNASSLMPLEDLH